jgi:hypothetical protein
MLVGQFESGIRESVHGSGGANDLNVTVKHAVAKHATAKAGCCAALAHDNTITNKHTLDKR